MKARALLMVCWGCHNKGPQAGWLHRNVLAHSSKVQKSKVKVWVGLVPSEASLFGLQMAILSLCPHTAVPLCVCVLISSSFKDASPTGAGPTLILT